MQVAEATYDQDLKSATNRVSELMDKIGTTTDGVQVFVNGWGRWCAKIVRRKDEQVIHAFGSTLLEAMTKLEEVISA